MVPDFTGYVTRYGRKCTDGRTILAHAFKGQDGAKIPLVYQHNHTDVSNILGHLFLEHRDDGVYANAFFNATPNGQNAKLLVEHGDLNALSIYANQLVESHKNVSHGNIREASLVLAGANPGAYIDNVNIQHGDGPITELDDEVIINFGEAIVHGVAVAAAIPAAKIPPTNTPTKGTPAKAPAVVDPDDDGDDDANDTDDLEDAVEGLTIADVVETMNDDQKNAMYALIGQALGHAAGDQTDNVVDGSINDVVQSMNHAQQEALYKLVGQALEHSAGDQTEEGTTVSRNVFEQTDDALTKGEGPSISHADMKAIVADAAKIGSLKSAVEAYALKHDIGDIDVLFPSAKLLENQPDFISRRVEWVNGVLAGTRKSPFTRIKTILADITPDAARAKGYITGSMKIQEFFGVTKRTTTPTTVYKKQALDRDDVLDITDFDVVSWMKAEMRIMLDEEVARAILIGDGRTLSDQDKIKDPVGASDGSGIRSILNDHEIYTTTCYVNIDDANSTPDEIVDGVVKGMTFYRGTGMPTFYTSLPTLTKLLLAKDTLGRRLYTTRADLASAMMVSDIATVEPMESISDLIGIVVNLNDYVVGVDNGGEINLFDNFDIDYNKQKYLIETRLSGALVKFKSALAIRKVPAGAVLVDPLTPPTVTANVVSGANQSNVTYIATGATGNVTITSGSFNLTSTNSPVTVQASPASGYYFATDAQDFWNFEYTD